MNKDEEEKGNTNIEFKDNKINAKTENVNNSPKLVIGIVATFLAAIIIIVVVLVIFLPQGTKENPDIPSLQTPSEQNPSEQNPSEQNPSEQNPSEQNPSEQNPSGQNPSEQNPSEQNPSGQNPSEQNPSEQNPSEQNPSEQKPSEQNPSEQNPSEQNPSEQNPSEQPPVNDGETEEPGLSAGTQIDGKNIYPDRNDDAFEDFVFTVNEDTSTVTASYTGLSAGEHVRLNFADSFVYQGKTYRLTAIGKAKMSDNDYVESINLANGIERIETGAFSNFTSLEKITLPETINYIGDKALFGCSSLAVINVNSIDSWCKVLFDGENANPLKSKSDIQLTLGNQTPEGKITLKEGIESIPEGTFRGSAVTEIVLPESLKTLGVAAFQDCKQLTSVTFRSVISSGENVLKGCEMLTRITIPSIEKGYFGQYFGAPSSAKQNDYLPESLREVVVSGGKKIASHSFDGCEKIEEVALPYGIEEIEGFAFYECKSLTSVNFSSYLKKIGDRAFYGCESLTSVNFSSYLREIGNSAFYGCESLTSVTFYSDLSYLGDYAFQYCKNLSKISLSGKIDIVGYYAIYGTAYYSEEANWSDGVLYFGKNLLDVKGDQKGSFKIREGTVGIAKYALSYADIESVEIPASVQYIGKSALANCEALASITVDENNPKYYGKSNCVIEKESKTLIVGCGTSVIPQEVTSIGSSAFQGSNFEKIEIPDSVTSIGTWAFYECYKLTEVKLSEKLQSIGSFAFCGCNLLEKVEIPASVSKIDIYAFEGCPMLQSVTFKDGAHDWEVGILKNVKITREELSDPSVAAKYLTETYKSESWRRCD